MGYSYVLYPAGLKTQSKSEACTQVAPPSRRVPDQAQKTIRSILSGCQKIVVGKSDLLEGMLIALLSEGHVLLRGVPGVAKTTLAKTFTQALGLEFRRIQCTPDLLPADVIGTHIFEPKTGSFRLQRGPVFSNLLLIDEMNRNTPKTNSAVLEAMQERQVTIEGETERLPQPFMVIATESPIEFHGVFPLPEVLIDRFLLSLNVGYPTSREEIEITERIYSIESSQMSALMTREQLANLVDLTKEVYLAPQMRTYIVDIVQRTRSEDGVTLGAGPRASIALSKASRARALLRNRMYVIPDDIKSLAPSVLRHRIVPTEQLGLVEQSSERIVDRILKATPIPPRQH